MIYLSENYRDFDGTRLVYQMKAGAEVQAGAESEPKAPEEAEERTALEIWDQDIEPEWGIEAFRSKIESDTKGEMEYKERHIQDAVDRYAKIYEAIKKSYFDKAGLLHVDKRAAIKRAEKEFESRLSLLEDAVENNAEAKESNEDISDHIDALNDKYLNYEWVAKNLRGINEREPWNRYFKGIPIFYPFLEKNMAIEKYGELSDAFRKNMKESILAEYELLKSQEDTSPEMLKTFRDSIESRYKKFANIDSRSGIIDFRDLLWLEYYTSANADTLRLITTGEDQAAIRLMEATQLMDPESWEDGVQDMADALTRDTEHGSAEGQFIEAANAYRGEEAEKFESYSEAKNYFEETLALYKTGNVKKTLDLIKHFDSYINKNRVEFISSIDPPSIQRLAYDERTRILQGRYSNLGKYNETLVEFVRSTREQRERMLDNKSERIMLFKAIQNAQVKYAEMYEERYQESIPDEKGKLRYRSKDRERPTYHDQVARLLALTSLGKEADGIIKNFSGNDKYKGIYQELGKIQPDENIKLALKFRDNKKPRSMPYRPSTFRGGFNGRDLGVKIAKIAGVVTAIANIANSVRQGWEDAEGPEGAEADFFDKVVKSIEYSITNPAVIGGAAVAIGGQMLENHPQYYSYLKADELGKYKISTGASLERLSQKVGKKRLKSFVGNGAEWEAMQRLDKDKITELMTKAEERANEFDPPRIPGILDSDIEEIIQDKTITSQLTERCGDLRYIFFSKYLNREDLNVAQLEEASEEWMT